MDGRPIKDKGEICPDCGQWSPRPFLSRSCLEALSVLGRGQGSSTDRPAVGAWGGGHCGHAGVTRQCRGPHFLSAPPPGPSLHQQGKLGAIKSRASRTPSRQTEDELGSLEQPERWVLEPQTPDASPQGHQHSLHLQPKGLVRRKTIQLHSLEGLAKQRLEVRVLGILGKRDVRNKQRKSIKTTDFC